ncbi:MAG: hypothetical protein DBY16_10635 [Coprobacter sp.]|nr:MAG: hypothetical protein DBY16_10635 [Coprobacter sp.]
MNKNILLFIIKTFSLYLCPVIYIFSIILKNHLHYFIYIFTLLIKILKGCSFPEHPFNTKVMTVNLY